MRVASTELEKSVLRGLMAGALWKAARVSGHGMRTHSACPHCGAAHEDEVHVLLDCPQWEQARETWIPWLRDAAAALPQLGPPDQWRACVGRAGLFPLRLAHGLERALLDDFLYRVYGMYLAVLAAHMAAGRGDPAGHGDFLFPNQPRPQPRNPFPWDDFVRPLQGDAVRNQQRLRLGSPPGWRWPKEFFFRTWSGGPER